MNTQAVAEQASAPSVEARAAALLFGTPKPKAAPAAPEAPEPTEVPQEAQPENAELPAGDPQATTDAEPQAEAPAAEETFEFEHEGEKWALPKKLEKAFQNNRDYTQKSQEIANQRRVLEAVTEQARVMHLTRDFEASVSKERQQLSAYDSVLSTPINQNQSPEDISRELANRYQWERERNALADAINGKHQEYMHNFEKLQGELKAKADEAVSKRIPGWNDAVWTSIREHAKADGYSEDELKSIHDPRHKITLWKAQQYDLNRTRATKAVSDVKAVKTTPSNPMPQHVKDKLAFSKALAKTTDPAARSKLAESRLGALFRK